MNSNILDGREERVLITGGTGFVGSHLTRHLRASLPTGDIVPFASPRQKGADSIDVTNKIQVEHAISNYRPTALVHLAAMSTIIDSVENPRSAWDVNFGGLYNVVEAIKVHVPDCRILFISSAEVYGRSFETIGLADESVLLGPASPYAVAKAAADLLVQQCGLNAVVARPFNHTGPGQSDRFALPAFAAQIARIEAGLQPPVLSVGRLDQERDFLDVADIVAAYAMLIGAPDIAGGVFNVASGVPRRMSDVLDGLLALSAVDIEVRQDPNRMDVPRMLRVVGDASRLRALGWQPRVSFETTLKSLLDYERGRLQSNPP